MPVIDMTGQRFGRLVVIGRDLIKSKWQQAMWACKCDCGTTISVRGQDLRRGNSRSCGCLRKETSGGKRRKNRPTVREGAAEKALVGRRIGKLLITQFLGVSKTTGQASWLCKCRCGKEKIVSKTDLLTVTSCGTCY